MKVIVFDLDNTLYGEMSFVKSGFREVSKLMKLLWGISEKNSSDFMIERLKNGRGQIFDDALKKFGFYSKKNVQKCLSKYRSHKPKITLYPDSVRFFRRFKNLTKYIVTDGNKLVQERKIKALGLTGKTKRNFITHRYGKVNAKPSPYCFEKIAKLEKVEPSKIVYIADDPQKDFFRIKPLGFKAIRVMRGNHKEKKLSSKLEAHKQVSSLDEIDEKMLSSL